MTAVRKLNKDDKREELTRTIDNHKNNDNEDYYYFDNSNNDKRNDKLLTINII